MSSITVGCRYFRDWWLLHHSNLGVNCGSSVQYKRDGMDYLNWGLVSFLNRGPFLILVYLQLTLDIHKEKLMKYNLRIKWKNVKQFQEYYSVNKSYSLTNIKKKNIDKYQFNIIITNCRNVIYDLSVLWHYEFHPL